MRKIPLLSLALLMSATSLQAQTVAVDTEIQEVLVSASLIPIAASRSGNAAVSYTHLTLPTIYSV